MILIVKIIVSRWDSRNISLFLHTFLEINELMMDPVPVNSKFNFPNLSRISPVSGGKPPLFISACEYFCGWPCVNRESLVGRDQWRTSRFGSGRDSVLGKMFTWVSRRRVTAPLGAALCDDLRRYYAQNNKVDSLTYMYRGVCRSDVPTHTRFTLSLREIAKLTSARLLSNESSRLDSQSVSRDLQQGLIRGYFYEKFHYGRVFASWWLISIERISFFKCREGCVIWLGKEGYSKEDGENYCCFFKERKVSRETKVLVKLPSRRDVGGNRLKSVSFFSEVVHRCFLPRCQNSNIIVDLLLTRRLSVLHYWTGRTMT